MFGYGSELSSKEKAFDLVNAVNESMSHIAGIARQFAGDPGDDFKIDAKPEFADKSHDLFFHAPETVVQSHCHVLFKSKAQWGLLKKLTLYAN